MNLFTWLFDPSSFPARWRCGSGWSETPWLGWLHILSDVGVWSAYLAIPLVLAYFVLRRRDLPFRRVFVLFVAFILVCGATHLMEALIFWWPAYRLAGAIKLVTAVVSWATVFALVRVVPEVLVLRSPEELEREITARIKAEEDLRNANVELEIRIEALRASEERFRLVVDGTQDHAIFMLDPAGLIVTWSLGGERIKQYKAEEILGRHFSVFYPAEQARAGRPDEELRVAEAEGRYEDEGWRVRKDGTRFWANVVLTALRDSSGKLRGFSKITRDMTARKQAEEYNRRLLEEGAARRAAEDQAEILAEQREQLRVTLHSIGDGVITTNGEGLITNLNAVAESLTGWSQQDAVGLTLDRVFRIVNEATRQPVKNPATRALAEGMVVSLANDTVLIARDDSERTIDDSAAPIRGGDGEIVGCVLVFRDVTDKRRQERELESRERQFAALIEAIPQIVWTARSTGEVDFANRRWHDYTGLTAEQTMGAAWALALHPDDRGPAVARWQESVRSGGPLEMEYRLRAADGGYRWQLARGVPLETIPGEVAKWFGTVTDIHDRKQADDDRQKFVSLVENSTDMIGLFEPDGRPVYINRAGMRLMGMAEPRPLAEYFFPDDWDRMVNELVTVAQRDGHGEMEVRFRHFGTGDARWMLCTLFSVTKSDGRFVGLGKVSRDITERRRMEDELRQMAADLSEADRRKDEFLATLAHELRNPLAPIRNGLQILQLGAANAEVVQQTRAIMERQLGQMVRLVDDLMDVSRITRNQLELRLERADLAAVVAIALETSRPLVESRGHELIVTLPPSLVQVEADVTRLAQVFSNLLNNSAKYTERGGHIGLTAERHGSEVLVAVVDDGIGIDANMLPKVFEMFTQVDRGLERSQGGLGIGLTLVKRLVEMHGGTVEARSKGPGKGSEFVVRLPVAVEADQRQAPGPREEPDTLKSKLRILVVDDNRDGADSLSAMLGIMGNEIRTAYDGEEAIATAAGFHPDVILLDIGLPKMNGYEVCRRIRQQSELRETIIIAQTGWGQDEDRQRAKEAGFDRHMVKPVDPTALMSLLAGLRTGTRPKA